MANDPTPRRQGGPVGSGEYIVQEGDCILSLAARCGHFWKTIWDHPANTELRQARGDPAILLPGDKLTIPPLRLREESKSTDQKHRFVRKGVPLMLRLRFTEDVYESPQTQAGAQGSAQEQSLHSSYATPASACTYQTKPRANVPFLLEVGGRLIQGKTDRDGRIEQSIPADTSSARLTLEPGTARETVLPIRLGHLDPLDEFSGVRQRLINLGFDCRGVEQEEDLTDAIAAFQEWHGLPVTGKLDGATRDKLRETHGS